MTSVTPFQRKAGEPYTTVYPKHFLFPFTKTANDYVQDVKTLSNSIRKKESIVSLKDDGREAYDRYTENVNALKRNGSIFYYDIGDLMIYLYFFYIGFKIYGLYKIPNDEFVKNANIKTKNNFKIPD